MGLGDAGLIDKPAVRETPFKSTPKAKAQALATAAGVTITGVSSITETIAPLPYPVFYGAAAGAAVDKAVSTPVQAGTNEVSISVAVVYLIP